MNPQIIRDLVRLRNHNHSMNEISKRLSLSTSTVKRYIDRAKAIGLTWDELKAITDAELGALFKFSSENGENTPSLDWSVIYAQSRGKKGLSLKQLWQRYCNPSELSYSGFCKQFKQFKENLPPELNELSLTMNWDPGEVVMIDYAGTKIPIKDPKTGTFREISVFVGVLAYSGLTFCIATERQTRQDWHDAIITMLNFFEGTPQYLYLDNSTSLVLKADKYSPRICDELLSLCDYYGCVAYAVAPGKPKYKANVEGAVRLITDRVIYPLRKRTFFSLETLNAEMRKLLIEHNRRPLSDRVHETRLSLFEEERSFLTELPPIRFERTMIVKALKVQKDYVVRYQNRRYSVPYRYVGRSVRVIIFPYRKLLQCFDIETGEKIAEHQLRDDGPRTVMSYEHMPSQHRFVLMTADELLDKIAQGGANTALFARRIINGLTKREAVRLLRGLHNHQQKFGLEVLEQCCTDVLQRLNPSYSELLNILDQRSLESKQTIIRSIKHGGHLEIKSSNNIRGINYYKQRSEQNRENKHE